MDDQKTQDLLDQVAALAEITKRSVDLQQKDYDTRKKLYDETNSLDKRIKEGKTTELKDIQDANRKLAKETESRLGVEETTNKGLKKALDERQDIEKKVIERVKKQMGEEQFLELQRNRYLRDELSKYKEATDNYGGAIKSFKDLNSEQQKQLVDAARNSQSLQKEKDKAGKLFESLVNPAKGIEEVSGKFSSFGGATDMATDSMTKMLGGGTVATVGMQLVGGAAKVAGAALEGAAKAALGMAKSLVNGERGMAVGAKATTTFVQSITGAVKAFSDLAMGIGTFLIVISPLTGGLSALAGVALLGAGAVGKLASSAAETAAELNELAAGLNDKLFAGFKELGKLSMTGAQGMTGVINNLHKMGLTVAEFDKFKTVIAANAKEMKMFGVTAEQGVNKFAEVSGELYQSKMGKALELMGISAEDQYEHTAKYLALQSRLGLQQDKNSKELATSTKGYIEELDKIAEITGASRKEQEDAREQVMAIEELRAGIMAEKDEGKREEMKRYLEVSTTLQAQGLSRLAGGLAKYAGAGGAATDTMSAEAMQALGGTIKGVKEGKMSTAQLGIGALRESVAKGREAASVRRYGDKGEGYFGENMAKVADVEAKTAGYEKAVAEARAKQGAGFDEKKFQDEFLKQRTATDKSTTQNVDNTRKQMDIAIQMDKAVFKYNESVGINKAATDLFKKAVDKFAEVTGLGTSGGQKELPPGVKPSTAGGGRGSGYQTEPNRALGRGLAGRQGPVTMSSQTDLKKQGLTLKEGDVQQEGAGVSEKLLEIAKQVQSSIPGFKYFSAFNDKFHNEKASSSGHTRGQAFDFVLDHVPSAEEGKAITAQLKELGLNMIIDEYNNPSSKATAGHFHGELKARTGGLFTGPDSGFPVELHGNESVWPENKLNDLVSSVKKQSIDEYKDQLLANFSSTKDSGNANGNDFSSAIIAFKDMLSEKLDDMVSKLEDIHRVEDELLRNARV